MELCAEDHDEICYEGRHCPTCEAIDERNNVIGGLKALIEKMQEEIDKLKAEG